MHTNTHIHAHTHNGKFLTQVNTRTGCKVTHQQTHAHTHTEHVLLTQP